MRRIFGLLLAIAAAGLAAGAALAAVPPAATLGPATPTVAWQGQPYAVGLTDPSLCPPQAVDPGNVICDHLALDVQEAGTITVSISWPVPDDDFDLYVCTLAAAATCTSGGAVASSTAGSGTSETVTFAAPGPGQYEVRVVPVFIGIPSAYDGTASWAAPAAPPPPGGATCSPQTLRIDLQPLLDVCVGL